MTLQQLLEAGERAINDPKANKARVQGLLGAGLSRLYATHQAMVNLLLGVERTVIPPPDEEVDEDEEINEALAEVVDLPSVAQTALFDPDPDMGGESNPFPSDDAS